MILSHTNPDYPLIRHLEHTRNIALQLMPKSKNAQKYGLEKLVRITTEAHDLGKATAYFQKYLRGEYNGDLKDHSFISACFAHYVAEKEGLDTWQKAVAYFIVLGHHGSLKNEKPSTDTHTEHLQKQADNIISNSDELTESTFVDLKTYKHVHKFLEKAREDPKEIIKNIRKTITKTQSVAAKTELYENVKRFLIAKMAYSLLVTADTISAALRTDKVHGLVNVVPPNPGKLDAFIRTLPKARRIDQIRSEIYEQVTGMQMEGMQILELPTGAGKTLTGLRLATSIKKPIVYTLPYTSIIDQTASILGDKKLYDGNVLPYHHLTHGDYEYAGRQSEYSQKLWERVAESWFAPIVVTTYEQVIYALTWSRKRFSQRMQAIGRNAIIFDEIQAVPRKIWDATWYVLRAINELFDTPILVMSATVPVIPEHARTVVRKVPVKLPEDAERIFVRRKFKYLPEINSTKDVANFITNLSKDHNKVLCVVNTRCDAYDIYKTVKDKIGTNYEIMLLSTYIPPSKRLERIRKIKQMDKWIVISTQVIEAGVDIDADVLVRDIAPLDAIVQSAGRCNRNGVKDMGTVIITRICDESGKLQAAKVYDTLLLNTTEMLLEKMPEDADDRQVEEMLREYYEDVYEKTGKEKEKGHESIPTYMGKMWFEQVEKEMQLIKEIPEYKIIIADNHIMKTIEQIRQIKEKLRTETNYEERIAMAKQLRNLRTKLELDAVSLYKPKSDESKAKKMLNYLQIKAGDALRPTIYDDTFVLVLKKLPKELRKKTEEVGISWICEAGGERPAGSIRVTGVAIQYAVACERELWFYLHRIETNNEDQNILIGRHIDNEYYRRLRRQVMIDGSVKIDVIKRRGKEITVLETKKSRKLVEPGKWQLLYYLYVLKKHGVEAEGYLAIPTERKRIRVVLTEYAERRIEELIETVKRVARMPNPPPPVRKPYCKGCAYRELCWV